MSELCDIDGLVVGYCAPRSFVCWVSRGGFDSLAEREGREGLELWRGLGLKYGRIGVCGRRGEDGRGMRRQLEDGNVDFQVWGREVCGRTVNSTLGWL
jgi:hypothetical protein